MAHLNARLTESAPPLPSDHRANEEQRQEREKQAEALLADLDAIAESIQGEFDSAADIRQMREEQVNRQ